ncbi:TetR/AcrR family transcriptional regulator [Actinomadura barringtoniae]|uniref:TetR/AcrR family transcriptional regulator n=1 Tax=Actinomadura barringtoniae TaxID=1427535 RepID=A0A939PBJ3_9ACTN|nr:TetR/AcrR family transcriptional regulator [Actinomadura barringtoniae]MBO2449606.1 TetR/AcrR family transcriptional regulator [Actinomadura barringtoniae]
MVDRRARLIEAAGELFIERAYDEVTTTEIAKRAGVAYGLIAHHFENKRGLYLATIRAAADRLREVRDAPVEGETPEEQLRNGIRRHIEFIEANSDGFLAIVRGGLGSDAEVREIVEGSRWEGAQRILGALSIGEPVPPLLRATMRAWVGYLDELILDRLAHEDVPVERLVESAAATLIAALGVAGVTTEVRSLP